MGLVEQRQQADDGPAIGTANPILVPAVAPTGRWTLVCQDREPGSLSKTTIIGEHGDLGDLHLRPYLVVSAGPGFPIDDLVGADPTGRFVVVVRNATLVLVDTKTSRMTNIQKVDTRDSTVGTNVGGTIAFDGEGKRLLYVRKSARGYQLVVRKLDDGREIATDAGPTAPTRVYLDPNGDWIMADIEVDRNRPRPAIDLPARICRGPVSSYFVGASRGSHHVNRGWARVGESRLHETAGLLQPLRDSLLVRDSTGALVRVNGSRKEVRVAAICNGRLIYADDRGQRLLAVCAGKNARTGILTEIDGDRSFELGMARVPVDDILILTTKQSVKWEKFTIDIAGHGEISSPSLQPTEVSLVVRGPLRERGVFAVRGDGAELTAAGPRLMDGQALFDIPVGPLHWLRGAASTKRQKN